MTANKPKLELAPQTEERRYSASDIPIYTLEELVADMRPENEP